MRTEVDVVDSVVSLVKAEVTVNVCVAMTSAYNLGGLLGGLVYVVVLEVPEVVPC